MMKLHVINSIRTNNFNDPHIIQKIKILWKESYQKLDNYRDNIYGLYDQYESNYKGDYRLSVAVEHPHQTTSITIPENEKYEVFKVNTTDDQGIINTWNKIWKLEESGVLQRKYSYDFEKYYPNGEVEIYIAVKSSKS